jgi:cytochrome c5
MTPHIYRTRYFTQAFGCSFRRLGQICWPVLTALMVAGCADQDVAQSKINSAQAKIAEHNTGASQGPRSAGDVKGPYNLKIGRSVFSNKCLSCHGDGVKGAPMLGNVAAWTDRVEQDLDILIQHAINGHGRMPPKGGFSELSDAQVASAVAYVVNKSQRLITVAEKRKRAMECHPINNPSLCTEKEMRDALTLHMMWLLRGEDRGS